LKEKKKLFLNLPEFPGGKEQLIKHIRENLQYPELARLNKIEGIVHLTAMIDDNGNVINVLIDKSLGYGCDEEAVRLVSSLHFGKVKNRGRRVKITKKFRIEFKLQGIISVQYIIVPDEGKKSNQQGVSNTDYTYTIQLNQN
jgi:protein TonB